jgi:hypothetical protein
VRVDDGTQPEGTPRWVKIFGIVAALALTLIVVLILTGRGGHGPGRHVSGNAGIIHGQ